MLKFVKFMGSKNTDEEIKRQVDEVYVMEKSLAEVNINLYIIKIVTLSINVSIFKFTLSEDQKRNTTFKNMTVQELINAIPEVNKI
jgi:hypothetical protein